ncbi:hypothetical protein ACLB2K_076507 [Fragaria x ananassa]
MTRVDSVSMSLTKRDGKYEDVFGGLGWFVEGIQWADEVALWSEILSPPPRHNLVNYLLALGEILGIEKNLCSEFSMKETATISKRGPQLRLRLPLFSNHFLSIWYLSLFDLFAAECRLFCVEAKKEDTDEIEDIYEIDDTDECGLRFSDAKYYDVPDLEPVERQFLSCFREVTEDDIFVVLALRTAHVPTSVAYEFLALQAEDLQLVGFMLKDLYNKLDEVRKHNNNKGDAQVAINWLRMKGHEEEFFFGRYTPDGEGRLANLFWRDTESLLDYNVFGDVVIIDNTYKTNIYYCPVILFVGSNNHRGSVLFACAIVANENEETFTWVI